MTGKCTTSTQDAKMSAAEDSAAITDLLGIIEDLDGRLDDATQLIDKRDCEIAELKSEIKALESRTV